MSFLASYLHYVDTIVIAVDVYLVRRLHKLEQSNQQRRDVIGRRRTAYSGFFNIIFLIVLTFIYYSIDYPYGLHLHRST
jgi:hypothetical protein